MKRPFFIGALLFALLFFFCHFAGFRPFTGMLSGTIPGSASFSEAILYGGVYTLSWFGFVLLVPIFAMAFVFQRLFAVKSWLSLLPKSSDRLS